MTDYKAGKFKITIYTDVFPFQCEVTDGSGSLRMTHEELADLAYCLERATRKLRCDLRLKNREGEV